MELDKIVFNVDTSELSKATEAIGALVQEMGKISTGTAKMAKMQAETEAVLARAAKGYAAARKANADAADKEMKSSLAAEQAEQRRERSAAKAAKAINDNTSAIKRNSDESSNHTSVLQRQSDILEYMAQGWSKGQAGILATAKAAKTAAEDMQTLMDVMDKQRKFMGTDPFDNSRQGLKSLQDQYAQATEAMKQYEAGTGLTAKQTRELARDKERLATAMQMEGKSFDEIDAAVKKHNQEYITLANQYNAIIRAEEAVMKQRREMVSASNYVIQAEEKMKAALDASNSSLNKAATDDLVKYETALRKSGMSQDLMTEKLATYKNQLAQVQQAEQKRAADHLARSLSPQLTDIGVSLWSGQSPFTVLIQQGGQMMDLFRMSGVEAKEFGRVMRESFDSMIPAMATVAKGLGSFVVGAFMDAGKAATAFLAEYSKITPIMESVNQRFAAAGKESSLLAMSLQSLGNILPVVFATGIAAVIAMIAGALVAIKQVIAEEDALAKALAVSGGYLNLSQAEAVQYAKSMNDVGVSTSKAIGIITEMAKVGNLGKESFSSVAQAASDAQKWIGISVTDTVKKFSDLVKDPMKVLSEFTIQTGLLSQEQLGAVRSLLETGDAAGAQKLAIELLQQGYSDMANEAKANMSAIGASTIELQSATSALWDEFKNSTVAVGSINAISYVVGVLNAAVQTGIIAFKSLYAIVVAAGQGIVNVYQNMLSPSAMLAGFTKIGTELKTSIIGALDSGAATVVNYSNAVNGAAGSVSNLTAEQRKAQSVAESGSKALEVFSTKVEGSAKDQVKELNKQSYAHKRLLEDVKASTTGMSAEQKQAFLSTEKYGAMATKALAKYGEEWDKAKAKDKPKGGDSYYETTMKKFRDNTIEAKIATDDLTDSQIELMKVTSDPKFLALSKAKQQDILQSGAAAIAKEKETKATTDLGKAQDFLEKVMGKSEGLGKQYYEDIDLLHKHAQAAGWSAEKVEEITRAIFNGTPVMKQYNRAVEDAQKALAKYNEESVASQADTSKENADLNLRLQLLGKSAEHQKIIQREHERSIKLAQVDLDLAKKKRDIQADIDKAVNKDGLSEDSKEVKDLVQASLQAEQDAAEKRKVINRGVAVQYAGDVQKEFDRISGGITDSIVTALFEGGKAGASSIRSLIVNELKKPVTLVVQAVVNTLLGNVIGGFVGGGTGQGGLGQVPTNGGQGGFSDWSNMGSNVGDWLMTKSTSLGLEGFDTLSDAAFNLGDTIKYVDDWFKEIPGMEGGIGSAIGYGKALYSLSEGKYAAAVGEAIGTYLLPGIGTAIGGFLGGLVDSAFGSRGANHAGGVYSTRTSDRGAAVASLGLIGDAAEDLTKRAVTAMDQQISTTVTSLTSVYNKLSAYANGTAKQIDVVAGFAVNPKHGDESSYGYFQLIDKLTGEILAKFESRDGGFSNDPTEAYKQFTGEMAGAFVEQLKQADIPGWMRDILDSLGEDVAVEEFQAAINQIAQTEAAFKSLGDVMPMLASISDDTKTALVRVFGGVQGLMEAQSTYYGNFYSEAERYDYAQQRLTETLADAGLVVPETREAYRQLVEAQDLTTEAGRANYAVLLKNAGAFAELTPAASAANKQIAGLNKMFAGLGVNTKLAETKFDKATKEMFESLGVDVEQYAGSIGDVISGILTGDTKIEDAGKELTNAFVGGINSAIAKAGSDAIAAQFVAAVITPILDNIRNGKEALEGVDLESAVSKARQDSLDLMFVLNTIGDELGEGVKDFVSNIVGASKNATTDINVNTQKDIARTVVQDYRNLINDSLSTVRQQITDARSKLKELESEADWVRGEAGMNFGQTGATPADTFSAKIFSSYDAYASNMAALAKQYEGMTEAQKGVLAELESEETRYLGTIERLDAILSEGKNQLKQMMSVEDAIGILEGSVVSAISTVVDAVGNIKITSPSGSGGGSSGGGSSGGGGGLFSGVQGGGGGGELGTNPWNTQYDSWGDLFNAITGAVTGETTTNTQFSGVQGLTKSKSALLKPEKNALFAGVQSDGDTPVLTEPSPSTSILTIDPATGLPIGLLSPDYVPATTDPIQTFNGISIDDLPNGYYYDPKDGMIHVPWGTYLPGLLAPGYVMDAPVIDPNSGGSSGVFSGVQGGGSYGGGGTGGGTQTGTTGTGIPTGTGTGTTPTTTASTTLTIADYKQMAQLQNQYWKLMEDEESIRAAILAPMKDEVKVMQTLVWAAEDFADGLQNIDADTPLTTLKNTIATFITALGDDVEGIEKATAKGNNVLNETRKSLYEQLIPEDELEAVNLAKVTQDFKDLGYTLPSSADAFRNLIDSLEDGALKDELLELIPAFNKIPNALQTFTEAYETQLGRAPDTAGLEYWTEQVNNGTLTQEQALKAFSEGVTTEKLNNRILELTDSEAYLSLVRANELSLLSPTNRLIQERIYALEDEAKALAFANEISRTRVEADIKLLQAQGNISEAEKLQREQFIAGLTGLTAAQKEAKIAAYDYSLAIDKQIKILQERAGLENRLSTLLGDTTLLREKELEKLDESNRGLQERIWAIEDADKGVTAALSAVERAIGAEKERVNKDADDRIKAIKDSMTSNQTAMDEAKKSIDTLTSIFEEITQAVKTLRNSVDKEKQMLDARAYIDMALTLAKAGTLPDQKKLSEAIGIVTSNDTSSYSTLQDFQKAQYIQANKLEELGSIIGVQKTTEEKQLDKLTDANKLAEDQISAIENQRRQQLDALELQLKQAKEQVDIMRGVDTSIKSVDSAISSLSSAIGGYHTAILSAIAATQVSKQTAASSYTQALGNVYGSSNVSAGDGFNAVKTTNSNGSKAIRVLSDDGSSIVLDVGADWSQQQVVDQINANLESFSKTSNTSSYDTLLKYAESAGLPGFAVGTNYVPQDMFAQIHKGEMIVPKRFNPSTSGMQQDNSELIAELQALRSEVSMLRAEARATAVNTSKTARILDDVTQGGDTLKTEVAA